MRIAVLRHPLAAAILLAFAFPTAAAALDVDILPETQPWREAGVLRSRLRRAAPGGASATEDAAHLPAARPRCARPGPTKNHARAIPPSQVPLYCLPRHHDARRDNSESGPRLVLLGVVDRSRQGAGLLRKRNAATHMGFFKLDPAGHLDFSDLPRDFHVDACSDQAIKLGPSQRGARSAPTTIASAWRRSRSRPARQSSPASRRPTRRSARRCATS